MRNVMSPSRSPRPGRSLVGVALGVVLIASACGGDTEQVATAESAAPATAAPTTVAATTTAGSTTSSTTTSITSTTTTVPPTTVPPTLPTPQAPPANPRAPEPEVVLGTIEIPKIGISKTLYQGISLHTLDRGPGHWPGTALPGQPGNVVVGGHRTSHDRPFRDVDRLVPGDEIIYTTVDGRFVYRVTGTEVVTPDRIDIITQTPAYTTTLFACHPPGSTRYRYIVYAELAA
jgi:sortase A